MAASAEPAAAVQAVIACRPGGTAPPNPGGPSMRLLAAAALALLLAPLPVEAGVPGAGIDGLWFKMKVKAKGWAVGEPLAEPVKKTVAVTCYVHVALPDMAADGGSGYTVEVWSEVAPDNWSPFDIDTDDSEPGTGSGLYLFSAADFSVYGPDGTVLDTEAVMELVPGKIDESGLVQKAKFRSLGMRVSSGALADGSGFRGGGTFRGATVDVEDLPFTP